jgi:hypothetical protein
MKKMKVKLGAVVLAGLFSVAFAHAAIIETNSTFTGSGTIAGWSSVGEVACDVLYQNGSGAREDYYDGETNTAQLARPTADAAAIIAAGGTITGDGLLADGALRLDGANDGIVTNEAIGFTIGGTMEEGEEITFSFNVFNRISARAIYVYGQLWDLTDNRVLATSERVGVKGDGAPDYTPKDGSVSYVATAAEDGHVLQIRFAEGNYGTTARDPYIDNYSVTSEMAITPTSLYQEWAAAAGLTSSNNAYGADPDEDGLDNLYEYGVGGEPTNGADQGFVPVTGMAEAGGTNWMTYVYARRAAVPDRGLDYYLETDADLVSAPSWTNGNYEVVGTDVTGGDFDYVTNRVSTAAEAVQFIQLSIKLTP